MRLVGDENLRLQMRTSSTSLMLVLFLAVPGIAFQAVLPATATSVAETRSLTGRWRVKFMFSGGVQKSLVFDSQAGGAGSFLFLDAASDNKPNASPLPAVWSQLTNDRVSFSGDAELPIGTCCREIGTLIFKGKFDSSDSISGKLIFVTSVDEEESPYQYHSLIGSFTATRLLGQ